MRNTRLCRVATTRHPADAISPFMWIHAPTRKEGAADRHPCRHPRLELWRAEDQKRGSIGGVVAPRMKVPCAGVWLHAPEPLRVHHACGGDRPVVGPGPAERRQGTRPAGHGQQDGGMAAGALSARARDGGKGERLRLLLLRTNVRGYLIGGGLSSHGTGAVAARVRRVRAARRRGVMYGLTAKSGSRNFPAGTHSQPYFHRSLHVSRQP